MDLVAHRGNAHEYPENTLPAFESALALGLRCLELDVQLSADGVPVVRSYRIEGGNIAEEPVVLLPG